jgi:hypothetical protein
MFRKLFIVFVFLIILFFAYKLVKAKELLTNQILPNIEKQIPKKITLPWNSQKDIKIDDIKVSQNDLEKLGENGLSQVKILAEKAKEAGGVAQGFVQEAIKEDKGSDKNISEKAFEYGKYIYCQEVVKQYEASSSTLKF